MESVKILQQVRIASSLVASGRKETKNGQGRYVLAHPFELEGKRQTSEGFD